MPEIEEASPTAEAQQGARARDAKAEASVTAAMKMGIKRLPAMLLVIALAWAPLVARAAEPAPESPAPSSVVPRIAANAAVYGSLYAVALTLVQATSTVIISVTPPAALGTALTFGVPAVMVVAMARLVPLVTENVPGAVLDWLGAAPQVGAPTTQAP